MSQLRNKPPPLWKSKKECGLETDGMDHLGGRLRTLLKEIGGNRLEVPLSGGSPDDLIATGHIESSGT